jgi:hypothetical protein
MAQQDGRSLRGDARADSRSFQSHSDHVQLTPSISALKGLFNKVAAFGQASRGTGAFPVLANIQL